MKHSHKKTGISPEDYRFSMSGGFKEPELERLIKGVGGEPFSQRESLLTYLWVRGVEKVLPPALSNRLRRSWVVHILVMIDRWLGRFRTYQNNQIRLIWGFKKS